MRLKIVFTLVLLATLSACGGYRSGRDGTNGVNGTNGSNGTNGQNGHDGANGHSTVFSTAVASATQCPAGGSILMIGVDLDDNNSLDVTDGNVQTLVTCNGTNGQDGAKGDKGDTGDQGPAGSDAPPTQFTPVALVNPCGNAPGIWNEVFLKLADGTILASFSDNANGKNTRFSVLTDGTYQTTDGDNCVFTLSGGAITYENHHY